MLDYLVKSGSITKTKAEDLKKIIGVDALDLAKLLVVFTGPDWATNFISSLPVDNPIFAGDVIAANFEAMWYGYLVFKVSFPDVQANLVTKALLDRMGFNPSLSTLALGLHARDSNGPFHLTPRPSINLIFLSTQATSISLWNGPLIS
jgi:hypothetical protein